MPDHERVSQVPTLVKEKKFDRLIQRRLEGAATPRQAAVLIAVVTSSITIAAGLLMTVADPQTFPSAGLGLWWAVQTVTTVGYGDYVPGTFAGRAVATVVMLGGIGFVTVLTAGDHERVRCTIP